MNKKNYTPKELSKFHFNFAINGFKDLSNKYVKINSDIFYIKSVNEFYDLYLCKIHDDGSTESIARLYECGENRYFEMCFVYNGIHCKQRIKYIDVHKSFDL